ncbi:MAG: cysteine hydrolase [Rhodospirillaceae bacterium]|jgi:nicotinamidase-related amidase|nr:cysteine hydrolase [Rhodospirillaceae bacterium]
MPDPTLPKTLLQMAGADLTPAGWDESTLILIDCQNEYVTGAVPLAGVDAALAECAKLLAAARANAAPVIHIRHKGQPGGAFDWDAPRGGICDAVAPADGETVIGKGLPNSFAGTDLDEHLKATERGKLIVAGFMTHMCISATVRSALDHGYFSTVIDAACATRDLPDGKGGVVAAADLHRAELVALSDRFCVVAPDAAAIG